MSHKGEPPLPVFHPPAFPQSPLRHHLQRKIRSTGCVRATPDEVRDRYNIVLYERATVSSQVWLTYGMTYLVPISLEAVSAATNSKSAFPGDTAFIQSGNAVPSSAAKAERK